MKVIQSSAVFDNPLPSLNQDRLSFHFSLRKTTGPQAQFTQSARLLRVLTATATYPFQRTAAKPGQTMRYVWILAGTSPAMSRECVSLNGALQLISAGMKILKPAKDLKTTTHFQPRTVRRSARLNSSLVRRPFNEPLVRRRRTV